MPKNAHDCDPTAQELAGLEAELERELASVKPEELDKLRLKPKEVDALIDQAKKQSR